MISRILLRGIFVIMVMGIPRDFSSWSIDRIKFRPLLHVVRCLQGGLHQVVRGQEGASPVKNIESVIKNIESFKINSIFQYRICYSV